jgi:F-type H+-transporting ATPase subunit gamma
MTRLAEIEGRIASMDELLDIVGAMRSLAGMRLQEAQHALPGIRLYVESMVAAIGAALLLMPNQVPETQPDGGRRALILCTAEHGFVGGFNERLIEAADSTLKAQDALFVLGSRGAALTFERGWQARWTRPMATRLAGAPDTVNRLTSELYACIAGSEVSRIEVIFGRYRQGSPPTIERHLLLPLDLALLSATPPQQAPLHNLAKHVLFEKLMAEYVFAILMKAAVESIASENAARFAAMESAHDNVSKKLSQLRQDARQARQSEITAELLDLITGAEALTVTSRAQASGKSAVPQGPCPIELVAKP